MFAISRDAVWLSRLTRLAERGGWSFTARAVVPFPGRQPSLEAAVVAIDRGLAGAMPARTVAALRVLYPAAAVALVFEDSDMGSEAMSVVVSAGADEVLGKSWPDVKISVRLAALRDRALGAWTRISADGGLKAERRSHRALVLVRGQWQEAKLDAGGFALLWCLMGGSGALVSRADLKSALAAALGRELEAGTMLRRLAALQKALAHWPGKIESVRGGFYRLAPQSLRRSTT